MASFATTCRLSSRITARQWRHDAVSRGYRTSAKCLAAQNFTMPALSPTMTEGNISSWRFKEGDSFSAGDVLLEIETDKATMDVEAQDDGILAEITQPEGSKGVKVGTRIGVLAELGDDLSLLEIHAEDTTPALSLKEEASGVHSLKTSESPSSKLSLSASTDRPKLISDKPKPQKYPLLPSVEHLMHLNGLDASAIEKMNPTGPNGRLLKGDVLAYLGTISSSYPAELSTKIEKLSHLDLSNIKVAAQPPATKAGAAAIPLPPPEPPTTRVAIPISLSTVAKVQTRIERILGVSLPLETLIARATDISNDDLPPSVTANPSSDDIFNQILSLPKKTTRVRGNFTPQIATLSTSAVETRPRAPRVMKAKNVDIIDFLAGKSRTAPAAPMRSNSRSESDVAERSNIFSVRVPKGDERRGLAFLERVKALVEKDPGRLVFEVGK